MPSDVKFDCEVRYAKILIDVKEEDGSKGRRMKKKLFVDLKTKTSLNGNGKVLAETFVCHLYSAAKGQPGEVRVIVPTLGRHNDKGESMPLDEFQKTYAARRWGAAKAAKMARRILLTIQEN